MRNYHKQACTKSARSLIVLLLSMLFLLPQSPLTAIAQTTQSDSLEEAKRLNDEAIKLHNAGRYKEAIPLAERVLAMTEKALGADHPDVAQCLNNLAAFYQANGDFAKPETLLIRALAIKEKAFGAEF